jgi:hypothetical protein
LVAAIFFPPLCGNEVERRNFPKLKETTTAEDDSAKFECQRHLNFDEQ